MNAPDPFTRFLAHVRGMGLTRIERSDYRLYEQMKAELLRDFPGLEPAQYERAIRVISRAAGV